MLSAEELLAGSELTFTVEVPGGVLRPDEEGGAGGTVGGTIELRPLTVRDLALVSRAARESDTLLAALMVQRALAAPALSVAQVSALPVGLVQFLLHHVNRISGIAASAEEVAAAAEAPLARAAFALAREYGWTPQQVGELTLGQVLLHLQMLREKGAP
jgi:hypothetical protein